MWMLFLYDVSRLITKPLLPSEASVNLDLVILSVFIFAESVL
jgi:hypothetical protein